ncbi:MAG: PaaI family thioesterase [Rubricella sp.]
MNARGAARLRAAFADQGLMRTLGAEIISVTEGAVEISVPITPALSQQHGYVHGGVAWSIGDSAQGFAAQTLIPETQGILTVEMKINFLAPAAGDRLIARGRVERQGRRLIVTRGDVFALSVEGEKPVATMLGTMMPVSES